jgi:hypothetical protein
VLGSYQGMEAAGHRPPVGHPAGVGPAPQTTEFFGRLVVISSGGPSTGLFVYSGTPALGNPPVAAIVAPGTVTDPFGNPVAEVANFGNLSGAHFGINAVGDIFLSSSTGAVIFHGRSSDGSFFFYDAAGEGLGNLANSITPTATTDPPGNTAQPGITSYEAGAPGVYAQLENGALNLVFNTTKWQMGADNANNAIVVVGSTGGGGLGRRLWLEDIGFATVVIGMHPGSLFGVQETWQTMGLAAGFTAGRTPQYQFEPIGKGRVRCRGTVNLTANQVAGTTFFTFPAGYVPTVLSGGPVTENNLSGFALGNVPLAVQTSGALQINVAGNAGNFVSLDGFEFPLD